MQKNYAAPKLTAKGSVLEITKAVAEGMGDPGESLALQARPVGAVGFGL